MAKIQSKVELITLIWQNGKVVETGAAVLSEKGAANVLKLQDPLYPTYIKVEDAGKYNLEATKEKVKPAKGVKAATVFEAVEPTEPTEPTEAETKPKGRAKVVSAEEAEA